MLLVKLELWAEGSLNRLEHETVMEMKRLVDALFAAFSPS